MSIEDLVPQDHILRSIDGAIDYSFIYDMVQGYYCANNGRPSIDPVVLFKIVLIQYTLNILDTEVLGSGSALRTAVIFFYLSNEGVSILENAAHAGLPIPQKLKEILVQLHDRDNGETP